MSSLAYPFLVSDLDGTLLTNEKTIPLANKKSIARYRSFGGAFTIATGRSYFEAKPYIDELELDLPAILCNGAVWFDPIQQEHQTFATLAPEPLQKFLNQIRPLSHLIAVLVYTTSTIYTTRINPAVNQHFRFLEDHLQLFPLFERLPEEPIIKTLIIGSSSEIKALRSYAASSTLLLDFVQSSERFFEILPNGISKKDAVLHLMQKLQLNTDQLVAVGDYLNDLSLLEKAGLPVAMKNAHPTVIQNTQIVVPTNEQHGVSYLIEKYLLSSSKEISSNG